MNYKKVRGTLKKVNRALKTYERTLAKKDLKNNLVKVKQVVQAEPIKDVQRKGGAVTPQQKKVIMATAAGLAVAAGAAITTKVLIAKKKARELDEEITLKPETKNEAEKTTNADTPAPPATNVNQDAPNLP